MLDRILNLIAPHCCVVCGKEGSLLCDWCLADGFIEIPSRCYRCKAVSRDASTCNVCRKQTAISYMWIASFYEDSAKKLLHAYKFERAKACSKLIAGAMLETLPDLPGVTVTYIPTATSRIRIRGYDQSRLIAEEIARQRGLSCTALLERVGQTRQVGANKTKRRLQAEKNYLLKSKASVSGRILLVDDVLTTGATLEVAARLLKKAGANEVYAAVFAYRQ